MKKRVNLFKFNIVVLQLFLFISLSFAISFLSSDNFIKAAPTTQPDLTGANGVVPSKAVEATSAYKSVAGGITKDVQVGNALFKDQLVKQVNGIDTAVLPNGAVAQWNGNSWTLAQGSTAAPYGYKVPLIGTQLTGATAHLVQGLVWAGVVVGAIQLIGPLLGADKKITSALTLSALGGIMTFKGLLALGPSGTGTFTTGFLASKGFAIIAGVGVAAAIFILTYKKEKKKIVTFQCLPFEPRLGGARCEECNKDQFRPCSEYRCKSLGQACQLLNPGTGEEKCTWVNPKDVNSPTIQPWTSALSPSNLGLKYVPDNTIRPPNRGVKITAQSSTGCLPAFTPLQFGLLTNEPSQCKIDYTHFNESRGFEKMKYYFGETNYFLYNHTQKMRLPGPDSSTGDLSPELENDGSFSLFVRCIDANGNENVDDFVFNFCVEKGPDTTPPIIEATSISSGSPIQFNADNVPIEVYTNEPADCKWSSQSKTYDDMENTMSCTTQTFQVNSELRYTCSSTLTGIKNQQDNKFYFRCKDNPGKQDNERNVNVQSHELVLKGTQSLNIVKTSPNETIFGSTDIVSIDLQLQTDDGASEGKSVCYFSPTADIDSFIAMFETNNYLHKQTLSLASGNYNYFFRCIDAGGNAAESSTSFNIFVDKQAPQVTRAYRQDALKIVTNEDAECSYSLNSCNFVFNEGIKLIYSNPDIKYNHYAEWKPNSIYYIKCRDLYNNEPSPNECSIIVSAVQLSKDTQ